MDDVESLTEASLDRLLAGRAPAYEDAAGLSRFAEDLRAAFVTAPAPAVEERHIAAMLDAARLPTEQGKRRLAPVTAGLAALLPTWRKKAAVGGFFGSLTAKIVASTVAATAATGGLAVAGILPPPIQEVVAATAAAVGIDLPTAHELVRGIDAGEASRAAASLDALVEQVADAAGRPHEIGLPVAEAAQACAAKVSSLAHELAAAATVTTDPAQAVSLAERATAIAHEALGCALPAPAGPGAAPALGVVVTTAPDAGAMVDVVTACVEDLKPQILRLTEHATNGVDLESASVLASEAGALAVRAGECAGDVGTAAGTAFALPAPTAGPDVAAPAGSPEPGATTPQPPPATTPAAPAPAALPAPLSAAPDSWEAIASATPPTSAEAWMGMTGSWNDFAQWMPSGTWYTSPSPEATPAP